MKLYSYWRSTTSYRVRIALGLKGLGWETIPVDLAAGAQCLPAFTAINPGQGVPALVLDDGTVLVQSMAILEWLEECYPDPPLLPRAPVARARVRAAALSIATDIHPVNNTRVIARLTQMGHGQSETADWMREWMARGLSAFAAMIAPDTPYSFGRSPDLADLCLVAQLYNAHRWGLDLTPFGRLTAIEARCMALPAFESARPENQPDSA